VTVSGGKPWWVLTDVCIAVAIGNSRMVASRLKADEKASISLADRRGIPHDTTIVNRPGLTKVLRYSTKPDARAAAERFDHWVLHEVLETIYETGSYTAPGAAPAVAPIDMTVLATTVATAVATGRASGIELRTSAGIRI
jgi:anti-repressor protein